MRKSVALMTMVVLGVALAFGTAVAKDNLDNKGGSKVHGHHKGANQGSNNGRVQIADQTTADNGQTSDTENVADPAQDGSLAFKGTLAQDVAEGGSLRVKVEKANNAAQSSVGKNLEFGVSSTTKVYRDNADAQNSNLDAKLSDLKAGDKVMISAKKTQGPTNFTASIISAETPNTAAAPGNNAAAPNTGEASRLSAKKP